MNKRLILVTSGEPSGIGPDICLDLAEQVFNSDYTVIILGDIELLSKRAKVLKRDVIIHCIDINKLELATNSNSINVFHIPCYNSDCIGVLDKANAKYVLNMLNTAVNWCKNGLSNIIVTAPVSKEIINQAGVDFTGHTEYFASQFSSSKVVMLLANQHMKVALVTTHLKLSDVAKQITTDNLNETLNVIIDSLFTQYGIKNPKIAVCGLNPHAGEGGYLGDEELKIINPVIKLWQERGYQISGAYPADTIFLQASKYDVILAMYHDQGLPVLKYSDFESGINITLGLPIIRTSVDHGTALNLAGSNQANSSSLVHAIKFAIECDLHKYQ